MRTPPQSILRGLVLLLPVLLLAGNLQAGATVKVRGDVEQVMEKVDIAFGGLELESRPVEAEDSWAEAVGIDSRGGELAVSVKRLADDDCEVGISGETNDERSMEERFLSLMQSR